MPFINVGKISFKIKTIAILIKNLIKILYTPEVC